VVDAATRGLRPASRRQFSKAAAARACRRLWLSPRIKSGGVHRQQEAGQTGLGAVGDLSKPDDKGRCHADPGRTSGACQVTGFAANLGDLRAASKPCGPASNSRRLHRIAVQKSTRRICPTSSRASAGLIGFGPTVLMAKYAGRMGESTSSWWRARGHGRGDLHAILVKGARDDAASKLGAELRSQRPRPTAVLPRGSCDDRPEVGCRRSSPAGCPARQGRLLDRCAPGCAVDIVQAGPRPCWGLTLAGSSFPRQQGDPYRRENAGGVPLDPARAGIRGGLVSVRRFIRSVEYRHGAASVSNSAPISPRARDDSGPQAMVCAYAPFLNLRNPAFPGACATLKSTLGSITTGPRGHSSGWAGRGGCRRAGVRRAWRAGVDRRAHQQGQRVEVPPADHTVASGR